MGAPREPTRTPDTVVWGLKPLSSPLLEHHDFQRQSSGPRQPATRDEAPGDGPEPRGTVAVGRLLALELVDPRAQGLTRVPDPGPQQPHSHHEAPGPRPALRSSPVTEELPTGHASDSPSAAGSPRSRQSRRRGAD